MDIVTDGNIAGFNLDSVWVDEGNDTITNNIGLGTNFTVPPTSGGFVFTNHDHLSNVMIEPELYVKGKPVAEVLRSISTLLKFMIEKYELHECKELKELAELDMWTDKVEVKETPEFLKDEDFKL